MNLLKDGTLVNQQVEFLLLPGTHILTETFSLTSNIPTDLHFIGQPGAIIKSTQCTILYTYILNFTSSFIDYQIDAPSCTYNNKYFQFINYGQSVTFNDCNFIIDPVCSISIVLQLTADANLIINNCNATSDHTTSSATFLELYDGGSNDDFHVEIRNSMFYNGFVRIVYSSYGSYTSTLIIEDCVFISQEPFDMYYKTVAIEVTSFLSVSVENCVFSGWGEALTLASYDIYSQAPPSFSFSVVNIVSSLFVDNLQQHSYSYPNQVKGIISTKTFYDNYPTSSYRISAFVTDCLFINNSSPVIEARSGLLSVSTSIFQFNQADNYQAQSESSNGIISVIGNDEPSPNVDKSVSLSVIDCVFSNHSISVPIISATVDSSITVTGCEFNDNLLFNTWRGGVISVYDNNHTGSSFELSGPTAMIQDSLFSNNILTIVEGASDSYWYGTDDDGNGVGNDYDFTNQSTGGAAIHVHNSASVVIDGCHFVNNSAIVEKVGADDDSALMWQTVAVGGSVFLAGVELVTMKDNSFVSSFADTSGGSIYIHSCGLTSKEENLDGIKVEIGPGNVFHASNSVYEQEADLPFGIHRPFSDTAPYDGNDITMINTVSSALYSNYFLTCDVLQHQKRVRLDDSFAYWGVNAVFQLSDDICSVSEFPNIYDISSCSFNVNIGKYQVTAILNLPASFATVSGSSVVQVLSCDDYSNEVQYLFRDRVKNGNVQMPVFAMIESGNVSAISACPQCSEGSYGWSSTESGMRWIAQKGELVGVSRNLGSQDFDMLETNYGEIEDLPLASMCGNLCMPLSNELDLEIGCTDCPISYACIGGKACIEGFSGLLCGVCMDGYYSTNKSCQPCETSGYALLGGAIVIFVLIYIFRRSKVTANQFVRLKILSTFAQMVMITTFIGIQWPVFIQALINIMGALGLFLQAPQAECVVSMSVFDRSLATFLLFFFLLLTLGTFDFIYGKLALSNLSNGTLEKSQQSFGKQLQFRRVFFLIMTAAYSSVLAACLQGLICTTTVGGQRVLLADPEVGCGSKDHNDLIVLCAFSLAIFGCGIPIFLTYAALSVAAYRRATVGKRQTNRRTKSELAHFLSWIWGLVAIKSSNKQTESLIGRWMAGWGLGDKQQGISSQSRPVGAFSEGYSFESLWFEIASLLRKALIVIIVFSVTSPVEQSLGSYVVNAVYLVLLLAYSPLRFLPMKLFSAVVNVNNVLEAVAAWILAINQVAVLHFATVPYGTAEILGVGFFLVNVFALLIFFSMFERGMRKLSERRKGLYIVSTVENLTSDWKYYNDQLLVALHRKEYLVAQSCIDDIEEVSDELLLALVIRKREKMINGSASETNPRMTMRINVQTAARKSEGLQIEKDRIESVSLSQNDLDQIESDIRLYLKNKDNGQVEVTWQALEAELNQLAEKTRDILFAECEKERKNACKLWMNATRRRRGSAESLNSQVASDENENYDELVRQTADVSEYAQLSALRDKAAEMILFDISDQTQQILYDMDMSDCTLSVNAVKVGSALHKASSFLLFIMLLASFLILSVSFEMEFFLAGGLSVVSLVMSLTHCALCFSYVRDKIHRHKEIEQILSRYSVYWAIIILVLSIADLDAFSAQNNDSSFVQERKGFVFSILVMYLISCFVVHYYCRGITVERLAKLIDKRKVYNEPATVIEDIRDGGWESKLKEALKYCPPKTVIPRVWIFRSLPTFYDRITMERLGWLLMIIGMIQLPISIILGNSSSWGSSVAAGSWYSGLSALALGLFSIEMRTFWKSDGYRVIVYTMSLICTVSCLTGFLCDLLSSIIFGKNVNCTDSDCSVIVVIDIILLILLLMLSFITSRLCKSRRIPYFLHFLDKHLATDSFLSIAADISTACVKLHQTRHETELLAKQSAKQPQKTIALTKPSFWSFASSSSSSSLYKKNNLEFNMVDDESDSDDEEKTIMSSPLPESTVEMSPQPPPVPKRKPMPPPVPPPRKLQQVRSQEDIDRADF